MNAVERCLRQHSCWGCKARKKPAWCRSAPGKIKDPFKNTMPKVAPMGVFSFGYTETERVRTLGALEVMPDQIVRSQV